MAANVFGDDERHVPPVGGAGGDAQGPALATAADPDRQAVLDRAWLVAGVAHGEPLPLERRHLVVEQTAEDGDALLELVHPRADGGKSMP